MKAENVFVFYGLGLIVVLLLATINRHVPPSVLTTTQVPSTSASTTSQDLTVVHQKEMGTIWLQAYTVPTAVTIASVDSLINHDRARSNLFALADLPSLDHVAQAKADDMVAQGYFDHASPSGVKISTYDATKDKFYWIDGTVDIYSYVGENLAEGYTDAQGQEAAWMASPTHRANILKSQYVYIGVGTAWGICAQQDTCKGDYNKRTLFTVTVFAK